MDVTTTGLDRATGAVAGRPWTVSIPWNGRALELECRENLADLQSLKEDWQALESRCPEPFTYFQSYDWCVSWCNAFLAEEAGSGARPKVYVLWDGDTCRMIWPLMAQRVSPAISVLVPLTAPMNQYSTLLYDTSGFDFALGRVVFGAIRDRGGRDALCLDHIPQSGLLARIVEGEGYAPELCQQSSIMDFSEIADWDTHHRALPKKQRLQRNSRRNKLEKLGALDYQVYPAGSPGYDDKIDLCLAMKQAWLRDTGRLGRDIFDPRFAAFLRHLGRNVNAMEERVFLHALSLDGAPIAMEVGMRFRDDYYCFLGAIDLAYEKYSPGKVQMECAQRWAIEIGIRRFDFLNDPSTYKSSWTNTAEALTACYIPFTSLGQLYCHHWMTGLRPRLRALYDGIGLQTRSRILALFSSVRRLLGKRQSA